MKITSQQNEKECIEKLFSAMLEKEKHTKVKYIEVEKLPEEYRINEQIPT